MQAVRTRQKRIVPEDDSNEFGLFVSLLKLSSSMDSANQGEEDQDEVTRETILLLLRLYFGQAYAQMQSMQEEMELLQQAHLYNTSSSIYDTSGPSDDTWRLDVLPRGGIDGKGPLMDSSGKVDGRTVRISRQIT